MEYEIRATCMIDKDMQIEAKSAEDARLKARSKLKGEGADPLSIVVKPKEVKMVKYSVPVDATYTRHITFEAPSNATRKEMEEIIYEMACEELDKLPTTILDKWEYSWDNVESEGIYYDYTEVTE